MPRTFFFVCFALIARTRNSAFARRRSYYSCTVDPYIAWLRCTPIGDLRNRNDQLSSKTTQLEREIDFATKETKSYFVKTEKTATASVGNYVPKHTGMYDKPEKKAYNLTAELAKAKAERVRLENKLIIIGVVDHMHQFVDEFILEFCNCVPLIRNAAKNITNPPVTVIPKKLIDARNKAKTSNEKKLARDNIKTFKCMYRQFMAILENTPDSNIEIAVFKDSLHNSSLYSYEAIALAGAQLNSELSEKPHYEVVGKNEYWNNKNSIIKALKFWNITEANVVKVASALHDLTVFQLNPWSDPRYRMPDKLSAY